VKILIKEGFHKGRVASKDTFHLLKRIQKKFLNQNLSSINNGYRKAITTLTTPLWIKMERIDKILLNSRESRIHERVTIKGFSTRVASSPLSR
jgi:hypothetical protein